MPLFIGSMQIAMLAQFVCFSPFFSLIRLRYVAVWNCSNKIKGSLGQTNKVHFLQFFFHIQSRSCHLFFVDMIFSKSYIVIRWSFILRRRFFDRGTIVRRSATLNLNIPLIKDSPSTIFLSKYLHYILHFSRCNITLVRYVGYSSEALCESRFAFIILDPRLWLRCAIPRRYCNLPRGVQSRLNI